MSFNEKMTAVADAIRGFTEETDKLSLDDMPSAIGMVHAVGYGKGDSDGHKRGYQEGVASVPDYLCCTSRAPKFDNWNRFGKSEIEINLPYVTDFKALFQTNVLNTTVEHITINGATDGTIRYFDDVFYSTPTESKLKRVTLNCDFSGCQVIDNMFMKTTGLEIIDGTPLDFSSVTSGGTSFLNRVSTLKEIRFKAGTIKKSISFTNCSNLSNTAKESIFEGLATVTSTQTLTLDSAVKILQVQKDSASNKGWTVYGGTTVTEEVYYG